MSPHLRWAGVVVTAPTSLDNRQHACVITLLRLRPNCYRSSVNAAISQGSQRARLLHHRRSRALSKRRRMGDSNPRGLAPNTLSNCVDPCSREPKSVYLCRSTPVADEERAAIDGGGQAGTATETATGTDQTG